MFFRCAGNSKIWKGEINVLISRSFAEKRTGSSSSIDGSAEVMSLALSWAVSVESRLQVSGSTLQLKPPRRGVGKKDEKQKHKTYFIPSNPPRHFSFTVNFEKITESGKRRSERKMEGNASYRWLNSWRERRKLCCIMFIEIPKKVFTFEFVFVTFFPSCCNSSSPLSMCTYIRTVRINEYLSNEANSVELNEAGVCSESWE